MVRAPDSGSPYVLAGELWVDTVRGQAYYDGINVPMFTSAGASKGSHDVRGMHFSMEKSGKHSTGMNGWDFCLFFPEGVLVCNPGEAIGMTINKHVSKMGHKHVGFA